MFLFKMKQQICQLSFIEAEAPASFGPTAVTQQAVLTFNNGRAWVLPLALLSQLIEPANPEAEMFLDGLQARFSPKPIEPELMPDVDVKTTPDGFAIRHKTAKRDKP